MQESSEPIIVPMLYVSRSGSTMWARYLSRHLADAVVLPETRWVELLLVHGDARLRGADADALWCTMRIDGRIVEMFGGRASARAFAREHAGKGVGSLVVATGRWLAARQGKECKFLVIKHGELMHYVPSMRKMFRSLLPMHVVRDPRGAAASPFRNQHLTGRRLTPGVLWRQARRWRELSVRVRRWREAGGSVVRVHYERVVASPQAEVARFAEQVGADFRTDPQPGWEYRLPGRDRGIHGLLYRAPDATRVESWKHELPPHLGVVVERATWGEMQALGYVPWFVPRASLTFQGRALGTAWVDLVTERAQHARSRVRFALANPDAGWLRLRTAMRRLQDRWEGG